MVPVHEHPCFNFDHKTNVSRRRMKKVNRDVNTLFHSSKIRISDKLLYRFRVFRYEKSNQIEQLTRDTNPNEGGNIH